MKDDEITRALGWFSVGLGLTQLLAPSPLSRAIGISPSPLLMRLLGLRELSAGLGLLSQAKPSPWVGARVVGDAMDLGLLGVGLLTGGTSRLRLAAAAAAVGGVTALDVRQAKRMVETEGGLDVTHTVTINRPSDELYRFWRDVENLPRVMPFVDSVNATDPQHSHWIARTPFGQVVEWDSEIVEDRMNERIGWRSLESSPVWHAGVIRFSPATGGRGTVVGVEMTYRTPLGTVGDIVALLFRGALREQMNLALRPFKQLMETGEIATTQGQSSGRRHPSAIRAIASAARSNPVRAWPYDGQHETTEEETV